MYPLCETSLAFRATSILLTLDAISERYQKNLLASGVFCRESRFFAQCGSLPSCTTLHQRAPGRVEQNPQRVTLPTLRLRAQDVTTQRSRTRLSLRVLSSTSPVCSLSRLQRSAISLSRFSNTFQSESESRPPATTATEQATRRFERWRFRIQLWQHQQQHDCFCYSRLAQQGQSNTIT